MNASGDYTRQTVEPRSRGGDAAGRAQTGRLRGGNAEESLGDGFVVDDEVDMEADYGDD